MQQRCRVLRDRIERASDGTVHHYGDEVVLEDHEVEFLGDQVERIEHVDPNEGSFDEGSEETYTRSYLDGLSHEDLKDVFVEMGGDTDAVDMRKSEAVIDAVLRLQGEQQ